MVLLNYQKHQNQGNHRRTQTAQRDYKKIIRKILIL